MHSDHIDNRIGQTFIFMQDNDPKYTLKICTNYLNNLESNRE